MAETDNDRETRARDLAFERGKREAIVDSRLDRHDERFRLINGSIEKGARNTEALTESIDAMRGQVDGLATTLATNAAVEADRVRQIREANEKQISTRQFWIGVAAVCATLIVGFVALAVKAHGG